jgi:endonuclease YncB( thermonuclease family)
MSLLFLASALVLACEPATIVAGDRLLCEGRTVQLAGIRATGAGATAMLHRMAGTKPTICRSEGPMPADGAAQGTVVTARCWTGGQDLGCALLRADMAIEPDARRPACR